MIPHKITLKNFLSYGEELQTIDFKNYGLICFSGRNGHGKSALLDAMTWALWGQARKVSGISKADEGLVRLGGTRMVVSFEFSCNDRLYRVRREFTKSYGKPLASLDFEVFNAESNAFISLTDKTIRATNEKIESLLGLDFDTFVNSSFIRQGQSNEFSRKLPKERKQILAAILGLARYDDLQQLAIEKTRQFSDSKKMLLLLQEQAAQELALQPIYEQELCEQKEALAKIADQEKALLMQQELQEKEQAEIAIRFQNFTMLLREKTQHEQTMGHKIEQLHATRGAWKRIHAQLLSLPSSAMLEQEYTQCLQQEQSFRLQQQQALALQEKYLQKKELYQKLFVQVKEDQGKKLYAARLAFEQKKSTALHGATVLQELDTRLKILIKKEQELTAQEQEITSVLVDRTDIEKRYKEEKLQFEKRRSYYQVLVQRGNWTKNSLAQLEERKTKLEDVSSPSCPLCEQVLTIKRKQFLAANLIDEELFLQRRLAKVTVLLKTLKSLLVTQHEALALLAKQDEAQRLALVRDEGFKKERGLLTQELMLARDQLLKKEAEEKIFAQELDAAQKELQQSEHAAEKQLEVHPILSPIMTALKALEKERALLVYDATKHAQATVALREVEQKRERARVVAQEALEQYARKKTVQALCAELLQLKKIKKELEQKIEIEKKCEVDFKEAECRKLALKQALHAITEQKNKELQKGNRLEHELARLAKSAQEALARAEKIKLLDAEYADYTTLAQAFGKNGIQALLIEEAIPEIEAEANRLLAKLTDNQAQIFIESLRDLKKGGVKETLDISISDSVGVRPYEMFSGGEAFRIDFALRIAISKLLARRAGTALQTLIIDEGFGSQDDEGLARIMDSIFAIQSDFSRIIIVSHLVEMKDNFPVHFVIEKGATGSQVHVEERG